jgi:hypothetical protein
MAGQAKNSLLFSTGFLIAAFFWWAILWFVRDKPVPNAIFTQSILDSKIEAARSSPQVPKVVFLGGSNVLFGIDSKQFARQAKHSALNFGCAAGMGPELILDLVDPYLIKGDLVVLHWEYGQYLFTRSGQVNLTYLNLLSGPQRHFVEQLPWKDRQALALSISFSHVRQGIETYLNPYVDSEIYRCNWVLDECGNIRSNQGGSIPQGVKRDPLRTLIHEIEITEDATEIFSDFVHRCNERGVRVIASWPNLYAHQAYDGNPIVQENFHVIKEFWESLGVPVVGDPREAMFKEEFFHDTVYHLNSKGVALRTEKLVEELETWLEAVD